MIIYDIREEAQITHLECRKSPELDLRLTEGLAECRRLARERRGVPSCHRRAWLRLQRREYPRKGQRDRGLQVAAA